MPSEWLLSQGIGVAVAVLVLVGGYRLGAQLVAGLLGSATELVKGILEEMGTIGTSITETNSKLNVLLDRSARAAEQTATAATQTAEATQKVAETAQRVEHAVSNGGAH